jgi:membrane protein DedA with SNARE-associated domain
MPTLPPFLEYSLSFISYFRYFFIFLGAVIEGPIVMIASGFLLSLGTFEVIPLFSSLLLGDLVGDIIWYYIGYYFAGSFINKYGKFFSLKPEIFEKVKTVFYKYHTRILFFSKIVMGFGMAIYILMVAGATKVSFSKYMILNVVGEFFFVTLMLLIGYYFGGFYRYMSNGFKIGFIVILIILSVLLIYNIQKYARKKALKSL